MRGALHEGHTPRPLQEMALHRVRKQRVVLKHHAEVAAVWWQLVDRLAA
jgi:hypothetical protein